MRYIVTFDLGTTSVKGILVDENAVPVMSLSVDIDTIYIGDNKEQNPDCWLYAVSVISKKFLEAVDKNYVIGLIMSGQMQDLITVDSELNPVRNAILYSDVRASKEAESLIDKLGVDYIEESTGNSFDGSSPIAKLEWLKNNEPDNYKRTYKVLISSKDYIIARLTGQCIGDVTACSTSGCMDIHTYTWNEKIIETMNIDIDKLPNILRIHDVAGTVNEYGRFIAGFNIGTKVYAGVGDAGATTLASGITDGGEYNINIGTTGWVASISDKVMKIQGGVFNLAAIHDHRYINVIPFFNAGNVHKWVSSLMSDTDELNYKKVTLLLNKSVVGSGGVMFLPYIDGERFPIVDPNVKGTFIGITSSTKKEDLVRACLEGVAYSIRQGIEVLGVRPKKISVIGGGGQEEAWCQILADIIGETIVVFKDAESMPARVTAAAVMVAEGICKNYVEAVGKIQATVEFIEYIPISENVKVYNILYNRYRMIYPAVKGLYK